MHLLKTHRRFWAGSGRMFLAGSGRIREGGVVFFQFILGPEVKLLSRKQPFCILVFGLDQALATKWL